MYNFVRYLSWWHSQALKQAFNAIECATLHWMASKIESKCEISCEFRLNGISMHTHLPRWCYCLPWIVHELVSLKRKDVHLSLLWLLWLCGSVRWADLVFAHATAADSRLHRWTLLNRMRLYRSNSHRNDAMTDLNVTYSRKSIEIKIPKFEQQSTIILFLFLDIYILTV